MPPGNLENFLGGLGQLIGNAIQNGRIRRANEALLGGLPGQFPGFGALAQAPLLPQSFQPFGFAQPAPLLAGGPGLTNPALIPGQAGVSPGFLPQGSANLATADPGQSPFAGISPFFGGSGPVGLASSVSLPGGLGQQPGLLGGVAPGQGQLDPGLLGQLTQTLQSLLSLVSGQGLAQGAVGGFGAQPAFNNGIPLNSLGVGGLPLNGQGLVNPLGLPRRRGGGVLNGVLNFLNGLAGRR
jgi:hypothetical protein